jgi:nicotinamide-nucleotide amidase
MDFELINTGTELLLGRTLNTHQQWVCRELADRGYIVSRQVAVPDTGPAIELAVREALTRSDWVITTGGLGPTSDDLTRERIAAVLGVPLIEEPQVLDRLRRFYQARNRPIFQRVERQALVPQGATVLLNEYGTAPGLVMRLETGRFRSAPSWLAMLPGPPRELRPMLRQQLLPYLDQVCPQSEPFICRTLKCTGLGESQVEEQILDELAAATAAGLELAYCARPGEVDVRLSARGPAALPLVHHAAEIVRRCLGAAVFAEGDLDMETVVVQQLLSTQRSLVVAESCTGGLLGHRITNVPGASKVFLGGWITYSNEAKLRSLEVQPQTLADNGAVSEPVAREMAEGARRRAGSDYALAITGVAGPEGGTETKPVGTVYIALAGPTGTRVLNLCNPWDRLTFKQVASQQALDLLRRELESTSPPDAERSAAH